MKRRMICVSYTRATPNIINMEVPENNIGEQDKLIRAYIKKKRWKLTEKYSDCKQDINDETDFLRMKKAGMDRQFECVVFASIYFCGKRLLSANDLLGRVFYPAGVHFAVAEDEFSSAEATPEEVAEYLQRKLGEFRGKLAYRMNEEFFEGTAYRRYGYVRIAKDQLVIDQEPAGIIREIFDLFCGGKTVKEIAAHLNDEGRETCAVYRWKASGGRYKYNHSVWTKHMVSNILQNRIYIGEWYQCIGDERLLLSCPPIIEQGQFDAAQDLFKQRSLVRYKQEIEKPYRVFGTKVYDLETDWPLAVHINTRDGTRMFRFKYPAPAVRLYEKLTLSCTETENSISQQLQIQKEMADHAMTMFETKDAVAKKEMMIAPIRTEANVIFAQMLELDAQIMRAGESKDISSSMMEKVKLLDEELQNQFTKIEEINQLFSKKNPWAKLYSAYSSQDGFIEQTVNKFVAKVMVYRFERVKLIPYYLEWFEKLPQEWFAEWEKT